ncbi:ABC transporter permease [Oryzicola mucosus]|uniref:ABC transporter permease subunit n=1 Tax=Oryzicola mucosus TaxID=2767425 RepID=A0A8J6PN62_9HYPH|nr:ABC transporter permease subunit [Oryzicola mucosus]MBD0417453.1 ABC transporter permease subunit [Oryzicola mucosus]
MSQAIETSADRAPRRRASSPFLSRFMKKAADPAVFFGLAVVIAVLGIVEWLVASNYISRAVIALPSDAIAGLFSPEFSGELLRACRLTFGLVAAALVLEILVAIPAGYFLYRKPIFGAAYEGWLAALFAAPIFLLYPLFMVIIGRNNYTLVFMGFAAGVIPIIIHARLAFMTVPETLINVGRSFHLSNSAIFWKIILPSGTPTIFSGIRLGLIYTLINIIAIEFLVDAGGLGRMVSDRYFRFDIAGTYTAICAVALVSITLNLIVNRLEKMVR